MTSQRGGLCTYARTGRLACLLAGTALASVSLAGEAAAVCNVNAGGTVNCAANTTTIGTTNLNGANTLSSDRRQEFNNGSNITATIGNGVIVDGLGLSLALTNGGGANVLSVVNNGLISSSDPFSIALNLGGNGGVILYSGTGNIFSSGAGIAVSAASGPGAFITIGAGSSVESVNGPGIFILMASGDAVVGSLGGGSVIGGNRGIFIETLGGLGVIDNFALVQSSGSLATIDVTTNSDGITISNIDLIRNTGSGLAILADAGTSSINIANNGSIVGGMSLTSVGGSGILVQNNGSITGGISASSSTGPFSVTGNSTIINNLGAAISANSTSGLISVANNTGITGTQGIFAQSATGAITIQDNNSITGTTGDGLTAISGTGSVQIGNITPNGAIFGALNGIVATGNLVSITTGGAVTGASGTGIQSSSANLPTFITVNHNVMGGQAGVTAVSGSGQIVIFNGATITGGANAISGNTTGQFVLDNAGVLNGAVDVAGSNVGASVVNNPGTWNTGTGNSTFSGSLINAGTVNAQNAVAGQLINFAGPYNGGGAVRVDLGDRLQLGGTANLTGGSLNAAFAPNSGLAHSFVVLSAAGGLGGTTFATTSVTFPNATTSVTYTATDVIVNILAAQLGAGSGLNQNQTNVAASINNFFNGGGNLPAGFGDLFALTGAPLGNALTQLSGEVATGAQPAANLSMGMFLNAMLDPFAAGRNGANGIGAPLGYARETPSRVAVAAHEAFAADMPVKARLAPSFEQRWSVWGAAYGGRNRTDGDPVVGSNDLNATAAGFVAGADYRVSRDTVVGMAAAVGQTRWDLSAGLGKGHSDVGQVGGYASTRWDNLYLSGALAFAWHKAETERTVTIAGTDKLEADFDATSIGGRLEGGYRLGSAPYGFTPYAAVQVQSLHTPSYGEYATVGSNQFALTFASQTTTDTRSELGFWADTRFLFAGNTVVLRGRAAWVHDFNPGSRINPAFQTLPGASFTIDGAAAPRDAALTSAVAEIQLTSGWRLIGKADGEFASGAQTIAGTGTARYTW